MLAERHQELLTAYVDGELSNRQRKQVLRLLRRSSEARSLLRGMQEDSDCLRRLPRQRLSDEFSIQVLQSVHELQLPPLGQAVATTAPPATIPIWTGLLAVAVVLVLVSVGSYFYFARFIQSDSLRAPSIMAPGNNRPADQGK